MRMPFYFFLVINLPVNFNLLLLFPKYLLCLLFLGSCYCQSVEEEEKVQNYRNSVILMRLP